MFTVYMLRTNKDTLYIGQTSDLEKRLQAHRNHSPKSAKYMRYFSSFELMYTETCETRGGALKREHELRQLTRTQKDALIRASGRL